MSTSYIFLDITASDPDADLQDIISKIREIDSGLNLDRRILDEVGYGIRRIRVLLNVGNDYDVEGLISNIQEIETVYSVKVATSYNV